MKEPYIPFYYITDEEFKELIFKTIERAKMPLWVTLLAELAYTEKNWVARTDFDGATVVQDRFMPSIAAWLHDWLCRTGKNSKLASQIFKAIMEVQKRSLTSPAGYPKGQIKRRYIAVEIARKLYYQYKKYPVSNVDISKVQSIFWAKKQ